MKLKLKTLEWNHHNTDDRQKSWATTPLCINLVVVSVVGRRDTYWEIKHIGDGLCIGSGWADGHDDGIKTAQIVFATMLSGLLEDEHEVMAAPRTGLDRDRGDTWSSD